MKTLPKELLDALLAQAETPPPSAQSPNPTMTFERATEDQVKRNHFLNALFFHIASPAFQRYPESLKYKLGNLLIHVAQKNTLLSIFDVAAANHNEKRANDKSSFDDSFMLSLSICYLSLENTSTLRTQTLDALETWNKEHPE